MPAGSRSSSLSSLSSVDFANDEVPIAEASLSKVEQEKKADFEVVIDNKLSPATSGGEEYALFPEAEDKEVVNEGEGDEAGTMQPDEEIVPDHWYNGGRIPVFKPVSTSQSRFLFFF